ncbi:synaptotagmin-10 isoform X2 [Nematostella vectensis]|uniref:synaptotagmin-10 isoform X2 n=1 Tax=Nematostella vectensis TaxID=45351 RepID=UPI00207721A5|nr:synaptotagmin-10 isoform X2 [Nematostella vectensis]
MGLPRQFVSYCNKLDVKLKVAIGFGVVCAAVLIAVLIVLVYKIIVLRAMTRKSQRPPERKIFHRGPSLKESDFSRAPQQRRHRPLMKTDSSASDITIGAWRAANLSPSSDSSDCNGNPFEQSLGCGKLEFSIMYDTTCECLRVQVLKANNLSVPEATTYVEVFLLPDKIEKYQTKVKYKNSNPVFNETFEFDVAFSELSERTLQFCINDYDGYSRHQALGEVFHSFDVNVNMQEDTVVIYEKDIRRDIFTFREENQVRKGEVLLSLCYLPTSGRLTFVVLKARLSSKEFGDQLPNPLVKVSLMVSGRQIKKTKTSVMHGTLRPVYNEAFVFDIPVERLSDVSLLVRMLHSDENRCQTIAKTVVGPDSQTSIGLHHWNCMMTSPRKPIAQWHPLLNS